MMMMFNNYMHTDWTANTNTHDHLNCSFDMWKFHTSWRQVLHTTFVDVVKQTGQYNRSTIEHPIYRTNKAQNWSKNRFQYSVPAVRWHTYLFIVKSRRKASCSAVPNSWKCLLVISITTWETSVRLSLRLFQCSQARHVIEIHEIFKAI